MIRTNFFLRFSQEMFYCFRFESLCERERERERERVRYVLAARIHSQRAHNSFGKQPAFGQPKLNCIRIAKINMFSFEMCHKITSEKK